MISPISFSSTYKVNNEDPKAFSEFQKYALNKEYKDGVKTYLKDRATRKGMDFKYKAEQTLIVPDSMDLGVEMYCANRGIKYKKITAEDLLQLESIKSRIRKAPAGYKKVYVDADKLEELSANQSSNLDHCREVYDEHFSDEVDTMIKSGDKITATTLFINPEEGYFSFGEGNKRLKKYVETFGIERLNKEQIGLFFCQRTNQPDHCTYFALKDLGMDKIPVYVDKQGYEAGRILGLFD